jgi:hypothetical protein
LKLAIHHPVAMLRTTEAIPVFSELEGGSKEERSDGISLGRPWSKNESKRHRRRRRRYLFSPT